MSTSASTPQPAHNAVPWTIRGFIVTHKLVALIVAALVAATLGVFLMAALGAKAGAVTDSTTCAQWGSANVNTQDAYARLYVREHGPVSSRWGPPPTGVINAINAGCYKAFGEDVEDSATVVQAISRSF